jgi:4-hydroxy-tetrahydrodipicolinate reductase
MGIRVCVAGATGWTGSLLTKTLLGLPEFELTGAIARQTAGQDIGEVLGLGPAGLSVSASLDEALRRPADVLVDYTKPDSVKARTLEALDRGLRVVIGTSGLTAADFEEIDRKATQLKLGVIAAGNFSVTAALAKHFALYAAQHMPSWEILDYADSHKPDAPSGTVRELAEEMAAVAENCLGLPIEETQGAKEARGAMIGGTPVHSIRLPSYVIAFETIFGLPDERLTIRHDAGLGAGPYVAGTLLSLREVMRTTGLVRGLDRLLFRETNKPGRSVSRQG